jgi:4-hydroxy-3-methylbut-2-en-1-yl diphosphate reductase
MKIIRAAHLGMCFGVRDAIDLALSQDAPERVTILGDLVHNETVLADLRQRGIQFEQDLSRVATSTVMITAHGTSQRNLEDLRARGLNVLEATCPLVHSAHRAVARMVSDGFHPVIIGRRDHVEVRGLIGDLKDFDVVLDEDDVAALGERPRFGIAAQTTQPIDRVRRLVKLISEQFPRSQVRFVDTVCRPTKERQTSAIAMARVSDVVIVIGGAHSNNTQELVRTCSRFCARVYHVQTPVDLLHEWFEGARTVGLTAGTSTPDAIIDAVERRLAELIKCASDSPSPLKGERAAVRGEILSEAFFSTITADPA